MCCTIELCLLVDKREKDNKQGRNDGVQCLCDVHSVTCRKLRVLGPLLNCKTLVKKLSVIIISQLFSFLPFAVPIFVPPSAISRYLVKCSDV